VSSRLVKANEIESITALAAKAYARVLEAETKTGPAPVQGRYWVDSVGDALSMSPEDLSWNAIGQFEEENPGSFTTIWERVKQYARDELESGHRAASVAVDNQRPIMRARFLVLREKYIREWQPRNVLESEMIDAICQAKTIRDYWMTLATERVAVECEIERYWVQVSGKRSERRIDGTESAHDAREEAERWDRVFIRSVRALRDLRRYTTAVIVNNQGGQVNVATDESKQTNVVSKAKKKKAKSRGAHRFRGRKLEVVKSNS
jgi:hypothetical protein